MANSLPRFGDGDGPLCKETDEDAFFGFHGWKIPTLADEYNNRAKIDRVSKGERVFEVLRDVEEIEHDFGLPELGVELIDVSKGCIKCTKAGEKRTVIRSKRCVLM